MPNPAWLLFPLILLFSPIIPGNRDCTWTCPFPVYQFPSYFPDRQFYINGICYSSILNSIRSWILHSKYWQSFSNISVLVVYPPRGSAILDKVFRLIPVFSETSTSVILLFSFRCLSSSSRLNL